MINYSLIIKCDIHSNVLISYFELQFLNLNFIICTLSNQAGVRNSFSFSFTSLFLTISFDSNGAWGKGSRGLFLWFSSFPFLAFNRQTINLFEQSWRPVSLGSLSHGSRLIPCIGPHACTCIHSCSHFHFIRTSMPPFSFVKMM